MSITSITFVLFIICLIPIYYIVPKKWQWIVLLLANCVFYYFVGLKPALYVIFTATTIYFAARSLDKLTDAKKERLKQLKSDITSEEKKKIKNTFQLHRKLIMLCVLLVNVGILCYVKYSHFALNQINAIINLLGGTAIEDSLNIIVPLGISFYTFQAVGYLLDVYWETSKSQKNYFKFLLFVSFFPQMTQGPISNYEQLSGELLKEHKFTYDNYAFGFRRLIWGFFKKLLVANIFNIYVTNVFSNFNSYTGITTLLGAFCYSIQIYADFSGYMDIMCGLCEMLGIKLAENFDRPYFSKSIAEYWRRWHITLGDWFKKYIYYPIGMSNWSRKIASKTKDKFGAHFSNTLPATIALIVVWTATGLWHGANWGYITWGLLNGLFIILSLWLDPVYTFIKKKIHIKDENKLWQLFQIIRTFILVTFIKVLPEVGGLRKGLSLWKHIFTNHVIPTTKEELFAFITTDTGFTLVAFGGVVLMLIASLIQNKYKVRDVINKIPYVLRIMLLSLFTLFTIAISGLALFKYGGGGFLYAGF